jgi:hypothetical protein
MYAMSGTAARGARSLLVASSQLNRGSAGLLLILNDNRVSQI